MGEALYNQLTTHVELAHRAAAEVTLRRKQENEQMKRELHKRLEEAKNQYDKHLAQNGDTHKRAYDRLQTETSGKIKTLEIQLAERVVEQSALKKSYQEKFDSLQNQLEEKTQRIHKIESDYEELQRKYTECLNAKQELQHEHNSLNEQVQRIKSMICLSAQTKRDVSQRCCEYNCGNI